MTRTARPVDSVASAAVDATRALAIAGTVTGTTGTLWALFLSVVYDRARVTVTLAEAVQTQPGGPLPNRDVLWVKVRNRGRRPTHIETVSRVKRAWRGGHEMSADIAQQLTRPVRLEEGQSHNFVHGGQGGYTKGQWSMKRWYVVDGGGRTFPLRERYRQRLEAFIFWPTHTYFRRQRRRRGEDDDLSSV